MCRSIWNKNKKQNFEGLVIAKKNRGVNSSFTVRKQSLGEYVEKVFLTHSPTLNSIKIIKTRKTRKSKLYYLRSIKNKKYKM